MLCNLASHSIKLNLASLKAIKIASPPLFDFNTFTPAKEVMVPDSEYSATRTSFVSWPLLRSFGAKIWSREVLAIIRLLASAEVNGRDIACVTPHGGTSSV